MTLTFSRISEQPPATTEKGLIYGGSGAGKTALFGSLGSRVLLLDTGSGLETLKSPWFKHRCPSSDPMTVSIIEKINARGEVSEAVAYDMTCDAVDYAIQHFGDDFDHVVVDDATALRDYAMNKSTEVAMGMGLIKPKFKELKSAKDTPELIDRIIHEVSEWQGEMSLVYKFFRGALDLCESAKKSFWVGAHEKFIYKVPRDDRTGKVIIGAQPEVIMTYPAFTGKQYPDNIQAMFDDVWHLEVEGGERKLRIKRGSTSVYGDVMAKTRHDGVFTDRKGESADFIRNPVLSQMLEQIRSSSGQLQTK